MESLLIFFSITLFMVPVYEIEQWEMHVLTNTWLHTMVAAIIIIKTSLLHLPGCMIIMIICHYTHQAVLDFTITIEVKRN